MFNTLYKKCLELAAHKSSKYYLAKFHSISSFFPIPPDTDNTYGNFQKKIAKIFIIATIFSFWEVLGYFSSFFLI